MIPLIWRVAVVLSAQASCSAEPHHILLEACGTNDAGYDYGYISLVQLDAQAVRRDPQTYNATADAAKENGVTEAVGASGAHSPLGETKPTAVTPSEGEVAANNSSVASAAMANGFATPAKDGVALLQMATSSDAAAKTAISAATSSAIAAASSAAAKSAAASSAAVKLEVEKMAAELLTNMQADIQAQVKTNVEQELAERDRIATAKTKMAEKTYAAVMNHLGLATDYVDGAVSWSDRAQQSLHPNLKAFLLPVAMLLTIVLGMVCCWTDVERLSVRVTK